MALFGRQEVLTLPLTRHARELSSLARNQTYDLVDQTTHDRFPCVCIKLGYIRCDFVNTELFHQIPIGSYRTIPV